MTNPEFEKPRFGTDGLRGRVGDPPMDAETLRRIGAALGIWLQKGGPEQKRVLLGHDGRESASPISMALAQGLAATEVAVLDVGLITTPGLAFLVRTEPVQAGVMISASHNPATDNGIKIFRGDGTKLPDEAEGELEELSAELEVDGDATARIRPRRELCRHYQEHLANLFGDLDLQGRRIVVDAANGAASELAPPLLACFGAEVIKLACAPDGKNINDGVGALHPDLMQAAVQNHEADFGISLDGDGDRGMYAVRAQPLWDGDSVLALMGAELRDRGQLPKDTVVATVMSNLGLKKVLTERQIQLLVTPVGDRAVVLAMRDGGFGLGGEQSGHILFSGQGNLTGDGLYTALRLLALPQIFDTHSTRPLTSFERYPQLLVNVPVRAKPSLQSIPAIKATVVEVEDALGDDGRVVLRYSGTENLCRVMVEGPTGDTVHKYTQLIVEAVKRELGRSS